MRGRLGRCFGDLGRGIKGYCKSFYAFFSLFDTGSFNCLLPKPTYPSFEATKQSRNLSLYPHDNYYALDFSPFALFSPQPLNSYTNIPFQSSISTEIFSLHFYFSRQYRSAISKEVYYDQDPKALSSYKSAEIFY